MKIARFNSEKRTGKDIHSITTSTPEFEKLSTSTYNIIINYILLLSESYCPMECWTWFVEMESKYY